MPSSYGRSVAVAVFVIVLFFSSCARAAETSARTIDPLTEVVRLWSAALAPIEVFAHRVALALAPYQPPIQFVTTPTVPRSSNPTPPRALAASAAGARLPAFDFDPRSLWQGAVTWLADALFGNPAATQPVALTTQQLVSPSSAPPAYLTTSAGASTTAVISAPARIVNRYVTEPVVERIVEDQSDAPPATAFVTQDEFNAALSLLGTSVQHLYAASNPSSFPEYIGGDGNNVIPYAGANAIGNLSGVTITNANLTASEIPTDITAANYLPLTGGTLSGDLAVAGNFTAGSISFAAASSSSVIAENATTTNLVATNASSTNLYAVNLSAGSLRASATSTLAAVDLANTNCSTYGNGGKLTTDAFGDVVCAADQGGSGSTVAGSDAQIQFNSGGAFTGSSAFTFGSSTQKLTVTNASTTNLTTSYASTSNLVVSNSLTLGGLTGFLKATAGSIGTSLINLASDVTGILPVASGGTGWSNLAAGAIPYGNGTGALATTTAGTAGYVLAYENGVPTWTATSTLAGTLAVGSGGTGATTLTGLLQGNGAGAITAVTGTAGQFPYFNGANMLLSTSSLFLATNGRIGIGTTTPASALQIVGNVSATSIGNVQYADQFPGASVGAQIDAACTALGGNNGLVIVPSTLGNGNSINGISDNCRVLDLRGTSGPNGYGNEGQGFSKDLLLRARWTTAPNSPVNYQALHIDAEPFSGGTNQSNGPKTNYSDLYVTMDARTPGQHSGYSVITNNFSNGDTVAFDGEAQSWGNINAGGDEGTEGMTVDAYEGNTVMTATVTGVSGNTVSYNSQVNENTRGEGRPLIITTPSKVYSAGNVTAISGVPPVITGDGTGGQDFTTLGTGAVSDLYFELDSTATSSLMMVVPIQSITDATHLVLAYNAEGEAAGFPSASLPSTYKIFRGGNVTAVSEAPGSITVSPATDFAVGDTVQQPVGYAHALVGAHITLSETLPPATNVGSTGIQLSNAGPQPVTVGLAVTGSWQNGIEFSNSLTNYGILFRGPVGAPLIASFDSTPNAITYLAGLTKSGAGGLSYIGYNRANDQWFVGGSDGFSNDGRVGIGTNAQAGDQLFVYAGGTSTSSALVISGNTTGYLEDISAAGVSRFRMNSSSALFDNGMSLAGYSDNQVTQTWSINSANGGATFSGNFGIGTTSPASALAVSGNGYVTGGLGVGLLDTTAGTLQTASNILGGGTLTLSGTSGTTTVASGQGFAVGGSRLVVQQGSGNVGIGTAAPSQALSITGNVSIAGNEAIGAANDPNALLTANANINDPTAATYGANFQRNLVLSATNSNIITGGQFIGALGSGNFNETGTIRGGLFEGTISNASTTSNVYGGDLLLYNVGAGTITNGAAANLTFQNLNSSGLITNAYGAKVNLGFNLGTITNTYGVYVGTLTGGTQTNKPYAFYASDANAYDFFAGNVGIGTTTPYSRLTVWGPDSASTSAFVVANSASTTEFAVYDTGNAVLAGGLTQNSDQRLKTNVQSLDASSSLAAINALHPVTFNWIDPNKGSTQQLGFIAQQVLPIFPDLISTTSATALTPDGTLSLNYIDLISPIVSAIQALSSEIASAEKTIAGFAQSITSAVGNFGQVNTNQLCVGSTCVTPRQFQAMVDAASQPGNSSASLQPSSQSDNASTTSDTPPVIQVNGNNPTTIEVGDTYNDLGVTITGPQADLNLGITTYVNGSEMSPVQIDTSIVATDTISYVVTDNQGLTATSTRTVIIEAPSIVPTADASTTATRTAQ